MITLTTSIQVRSVLGSNTFVDYDKLVLGPFNMNAVNGQVNASVRLTSIGTPSMQPIIGTLSINIPANELVIEIVQVDFFRRVALSAGQITALQTVIENSQAQLENGLITLGVVAGTRSAGV